MMRVRLTNFELFMASMVGVRRNLEQGQKNGRLGNETTNKVQNKDFGWHTDIESAAAEMAFAKLFNLYWNGSFNTYKTMADVAEFEIRHTQHDDGKLIIRPGDVRNSEDKDKTYFLVTGTTPIFCVRGWVVAGDIMNDKFLFKGFNGMPDAWFIPQHDLNKDFSLFEPRDDT